MGNYKTSAKILFVSGDLKNSINKIVGNDFAEVGSRDIPYVAIHQFGGTIKRMRKNKQGRRLASPIEEAAYSINIPARPYMPFFGGQLQAGVEDEIRETIRRFLMQF